MSEQPTRRVAGGRVGSSPGKITILAAVYEKTVSRFEEYFYPTSFSFTAHGRFLSLLLNTRGKRLIGQAENLHPIDHQLANGFAAHVGPPQ